MRKKMMSAQNWNNCWNFLNNNFIDANVVETAVKPYDIKQ